MGLKGDPRVKGSPYKSLTAAPNVPGRHRDLQAKGATGARIQPFLPNRREGQVAQALSQHKTREEGPRSGDSRRGVLKAGELNGQTLGQTLGHQQEPRGHSGPHCPQASGVLLATDKRFMM